MQHPTEKNTPLLPVVTIFHSKKQTNMPPAKCTEYQLTHKCKLDQLELEERAVDLELKLLLLLPPPPPPPPPGPPPSPPPPPSPLQNYFKCCL
jgi:hypothetical protein